MEVNIIVNPKIIFVHNNLGTVHSGYQVEKTKKF